MKQKSPEEKQLNLGLKQSPFNNFFKFKKKVDNVAIKLNSRQYTKSVFMWFSLTISASLIASQIYIIIENIQALPTVIPILNILVDTSGRLLPVEFLYFLPSISILTMIISITLSSRNYTKERELSNSILFVLLLSTSLTTLALIRLINAYTI